MSTTINTSFSSCMHDQMLESNRDDVKLEAMRCITLMTAKGKLSVPRTLFPHIVKNISSKNAELKKLIYLYLANFADQEPDLALLSVSTLQKSLKSPNVMIRASALKTLTSMRLSILSAILFTTIRNSISDMSPHVRKTSAHSIIKLYRLEPSFVEELTEFVERLLKDKSSIVLSSAFATFEIVCPQKIDIIESQFDRFCAILPDCNEWGQVVLLKMMKRFMLKRYEAIKRGELPVDKKDFDPKLLLRSAKPLVHSDNSAVVIATVDLFMAIANSNEVRSTIVKPMIRLTQSQREIQLLVLGKIEKLTEHSSIDDELNEDVEKEVKFMKMAERIDETKEDEKSKVEEESIAGENDCQSKEYEEIKDAEKDEMSQEHQKDNSESQADATGHVNDEQIKQQEDDEEFEDEEEYEEYEEEIEETDDEDQEEEFNNEIDELNNYSELDSNIKSTGAGESPDRKLIDALSRQVSRQKTSTSKSCNSKQSIADTQQHDQEAIDYLSRINDIESNKTPSAYREMFRPYIKSFYIKHNDCTKIRLAKLRILTNLTSSINVTQILNELQAYISIYVDDREFVSAAIHSIGICALSIKEVAGICLNRLTSLLSNNNEHIVSEAIVVLRSQIINRKITKPKSSNQSSRLAMNDSQSEIKNAYASSDEKHRYDESSDTESRTSKEKLEDNETIVSTVIKQVTRLLPKVAAPHARATILWILADFCGKNLTAVRCAPDVLRCMVKSFAEQDAMVKLQTLTLASKLLITLEEQKELKQELFQKVELLTNYLFSLAKYDINHDVRDRGRFMRKLSCNHEVSRQVLLINDQTSNLLLPIPK